LSVSLRSETLKGALARLVEAGHASAAAGILEQVREIALDPEAIEAIDAARLLAGAARLYAKSDGAKAVGLLSEALAAVRRVERDDDKIRGLAEVGRAYAEAGDRKTAEALLDEAQQFAASFGDYMDAEMRDVARAYAAAGLTDKALKAVPVPADDDWEPTSVYLQATAASSSGRPEALQASLSLALSKVASFEWDNTRSGALSDLAVTYGRLSPDLLTQVLSAARALGNDTARAKALAAVGDVYAEAGRKEAALDAWRQAYEAARAVKLRKEDYKVSSSTRGDDDKLRLLSALTFKLIQAGEHARAPEFARDMRAVQAAALALTKGGPASVREADASIAGLAEELTRAGQKEAALAVLAEAGDPYEKPGPNTNPFSRATALAAVGTAYANAGDRERAAVYLRRALQIADAIEDYGGQEKFWALVNIGARYEETGLRPDARARKSLRQLVRGVEKERE
jgi:tetratricopeptide (TPR) repeat protein